MVDPDKSWIVLHRSLLMNDLWKAEAFTRGQAWVDLLMLANWKDGIAVLKGEKVPYQRGQLCRAIKQLAVRWKWSEGKVKRYLELLRDLEQISFKNWPENGAQNGAQKRYVTTVITITNYNEYQFDGAQDEVKTEREESANGAPTERQRSGGKKLEVKTKKQEGDFELPDWVPQDAWEGWLEVRKKKKAPSTKRAFDLAVAKLVELRTAGNDPGEVLDQSTARGWAGLFEVKAKGREQPQQKVKADKYWEQQERARQILQERGILE